MSWIEIFKAGEHTDAQGQKRRWTQADLDKMVTQYNQGDHEAPLVLGHPKDNAPAYGWVESLKREGDLLLARPKEVVKKFQDWINEGRFKKRSISLYPDLTLRHVGFLGAFPPSVKGLKDFKFGEARQKEEESREFLEYSNEPTPEIEASPQRSLEAKALHKAKIAVAKQKAKATQVAQEFSEFRAQQKRAEEELWVDRQISAGRLLPAWKQAGLVDFLCHLEGTQEFYEFCDSEETLSLLAWFKGFLESLESHELFTRMQGPTKKASLTDEEEADRLGQKIASTTRANRPQTETED